LKQVAQCLGVQSVGNVLDEQGEHVGNLCSTIAV
jgi:hypothetical protein